MSTRSNRRDFLTGKAAVRAAENLVDRASAPVHQPASPPVTSPPLIPQPRLLQHLTRRAMACDFQVFLNEGQSTDAAERAMEALDLVERLEGQLSVYRDDSEVTRINQLAAHEPV